MYASEVRRTTISLPDELQDALQRYRADREAEAPLSAVAQAAIREFLAKRGYLQEPGETAFRITPAPAGSDASDVSANHNRYFAESVERR